MATDHGVIAQECTNGGVSVRVEVNSRSSRRLNNSAPIFGWVAQW